MSLPRLTEHQAEVFDRISRRLLNGWPYADHRYVGSPGALAHLTEKGYLRLRTEYGPRGGVIRLYTLTDAGRDAAERRRAQ